MMRAAAFLAAFVVGCGVGVSEIDDRLAVMVEPGVVEDAPDCADMGGPPAGSQPARIDGASSDLRAYLEGGRVICVGLVDFSTSEGSMSSVAPPLEQAMPSVEEAAGTSIGGESPSPPSPSCLTCGKDPEPMNPRAPRVASN